ncbi:MAG: AI-2E family transporter [Desulfobulbaceae bacterium]|jgi:predicted PurR-regulated permease PerM|nr:AI-2E family transporter [Desulfobulbaceae bacterium]
MANDKEKGTLPGRPVEPADGSQYVHRGRDDHARLEQRSFLFILALVSLLFLYLLKPFFGSIFWACVIALLFYPLHSRLSRLWGSPSLAALTTLAACLLIGIVPTLFVVGSFVREGAALYQRLQSGALDPGDFIDPIKQSFPVVQDFLDRFNVDIDKVKAELSGAAITVSRYIAQNAAQFGQSTMQFLISLALMLYVAFFMLRDGPGLVRLLVRALPLGDEREQLLFDKLAEVTRATVKGNLVVAMVQGALGGIIFWLLGIQGAVLWGVIMTLLSLIPVVGAGLIWGPVAVYLFAVGQVVQGVILVVFGAGVIGLADNILRPLLVGRDTKLPDYLVLLSTLGGFVLFGMNGFVLGPLTAVVFVAVWEIFIREFNVQPARGQDDPGEEESPPE